MSKKAQGISLNVIIIAAIALLVLVILSVIFMGRMGTFGQQTKSCESNKGKCLATCNTEFPTQFDAYECPTAQVCCLPVG
jgi:hypothetical protein